MYTYIHIYEQNLTNPSFPTEISKRKHRRQLISKKKIIKFYNFKIISENYNF